MFSQFSRHLARLTGRPLTFFIALAVVIVWGATGPLFGYSDAWQLVINTGTTVVTFLMVFVIQNTQDRETQTLHLKIDELIRASSKARNEFIHMHDSSNGERAQHRGDLDDLSRIVK